MILDSHFKFNYSIKKLKLTAVLVKKTKKNQANKNTQVYKMLQNKSISKLSHF